MASKIKNDSRIFIVGDRSPAGAAFIRFFKAKDFTKLFSESSCALDLADQTAVYQFFKETKPEYIFFTYIRSGGILANIKYPAEFIYDNLQIQNNIIHYSYKFGVKKLLFFGSSCMYPADSKQPIKEEYLYSGKLEKTSEPYAIAKLAGVKMCQSYSQQYGVNFISLIPATIYGPNDDFDLAGGHVISSLIRKFHEARINKKETVSVWGTGKPHREFIYIDDIIDASIFLMDKYYSSEAVNVGCGEDITVKELAMMIKEIVGFKGKIFFDTTKPDGAAKKLLDNSKIAKLGWRPKIALNQGIIQTYNWYKENVNQNKKRS